MSVAIVCTKPMANQLSQLSLFLLRSSFTLIVLGSDSFWGRGRFEWVHCSGDVRNAGSSRSVERNKEDLTSYLLLTCLHGLTCFFEHWCAYRPSSGAGPPELSRERLFCFPLFFCLCGHFRPPSLSVVSFCFSCFCVVRDAVCELILRVPV